MSENSIDHIVDLQACPLDDTAFRQHCKDTLNNDGVLLLSRFLTSDALTALAAEGHDNQPRAYFTQSAHNVYLSPTDPDHPPEHARNRTVRSTKGCITTDQIPDNSALRSLYDSRRFRAFLCAVLEEDELHEYADPLSGINLHYAAKGQELGWHFDNSSFAITLLIQQPTGGGVFEYVRDARNAEEGDMNFALATDILDGKASVSQLAMQPGALVLFRGRNSIHRVTPTQGQVTRMLAVLAYNTQPGISLSESARMTFYGRLG